MSDAELKGLLAELARQQSEFAKQRAELAKEQAELAKRQDEMAKRRDEDHAQTEKVLRDVTRQLGGLGNKFGSFTEGLAFDSMRRILKRHFGAEIVSSRTNAFRGGQTQEFDMVGVRNGPQGEVYVVEVKSELNAKELNKTLKKLREFFDFMPYLKGMKLYGIISAVDVRGALADRVLHEGLYLATAGDENFKLVKPPRDFKPKVSTAD